MSPSEAFKRGFYGGFGLWCSFMVINIIFAIAVVAGLMSLGLLGAVASVPMGKPRTVYSTPEPEQRTDAASESIQRALPLHAPARRRQTE